MTWCEYDEERDIFYTPPVPFRHYELNKRRHRWEHYPFGEGPDVPEWAGPGRLTHEQRQCLVTRDAAVASSKMHLMSRGARARLKELSVPSRASCLADLGLLSDQRGGAEAFRGSNGLELYEYQKAGVVRVLERFREGYKSALIADEMGLGKSPQAVKVMDALSPVKTLIVCPASLVLNWQREVMAWSDGVEPGDIELGAGREYTKVRITSYSKAARMVGQRFNLVIFDEAHFLKNPGSKRSRACLFDKDSLAAGADHVLALTGTPAPNGALDIWWALNMLDPDRWDSQDTFKKLYGRNPNPYGQNLTRYERDQLDIINVWLRLNGMTRREKSQVLTQLPPKTRRIVEFKPTGADKSLIATQRGLAEEVAKQEDFERSAYIGRLRASLDGGVMAVRKQLSLSRVPHIIRYVNDTSDPEDSIIFFCVFRGTMDALVEGLGGAEKVAVVRGGMDQQSRQEDVDAFQAGRKRFFVGQIVAAGTGLTLTRSSRTIFVDIDWTPANMEQAEDRNHRIGQDEAVLIEYPVFSGSIDHAMIIKLAQKTEERKAVRGG